jgi:hypothetical protein
MDAKGPNVCNSFIGNVKLGRYSRNQAITMHDSGWVRVGSGGVTGKPDVEKRKTGF